MVNNGGMLRREFTRRNHSTSQLRIVRLLFVLDGLDLIPRSYRKVYKRSHKCNQVRLIYTLRPQTWGPFLLSLLSNFTSEYTSGTRNFKIIMNLLLSCLQERLHSELNLMNKFINQIPATSHADHGAIAPLLCSRSAYVTYKTTS